MQEYFLEVKNLHKTFTPSKDLQVNALTDINLIIDKGAFVVISGPSGSGKTTLLNTLGGLDSVTSGDVLLEGTTISNLPEKELSLIRRTRIGFVFQAYNLVPVLTAHENIEYIMRLLHWSSTKRKQRVEEVAKKLGIEELLYKLPNQLSGGQQQRVAVARAVAAKPPLILADEPTANLDSKSAGQLMDMMLRLNEDEGVTIIFASHDPEIINKARHSIIMKDGRILQNLPEAKQANQNHENAS